MRVTSETSPTGETSAVTRPEALPDPTTRTSGIVSVWSR
jgi:hypothetical protein